jgi:hypothetical protein
LTRRSARRACRVGGRAGCAPRITAGTGIKTTINTYGHLLPSVDAALADGLAELFEADNVVPLRPSVPAVAPVADR